MKMQRIAALAMAGLMAIGTSALANTVEIGNGPANTPVPISAALPATYESEVLLIDGVAMLPLRTVLEGLDYEISWNDETRSIEILKGPRWTSIAIGNNAYFKNRMAPRPLSKAPVIVEDRTYVPAEFFPEIMDLHVESEDGRLIVHDAPSTVFSGFVKDIIEKEDGGRTLVLTTDLSSDALELMTIIHTSKEGTFYQKDVAVGDQVQAATAMYMTMSLPGQTFGFVVY